MFGEGRTTRSSKKMHYEPSETLHSRSKQLVVPDLLTPPPSQSVEVGFEPRKTRRWRGKRAFEEPLLDQPPPTPKKPRYGDEVAHPSAYSSLDVSCSSGSDPSSTTFHNDPISLAELEFELTGLADNGLASDNDPFMADGKGGRELHTPTPLSPNNTIQPPRPETPIVRPETPGNSSPLTPMDAIMGSAVLDNDDDHDTSSLVAGTTLSQYEPPPTPLCLTRVGNLSSSSTSSTTSLLQLSPAIRTTTPTSAAPPLKILESDDDDDEDVVNFQNNNQINHSNNSNNSKESPVTPLPPLFQSLSSSNEHLSSPSTDKQSAEVLETSAEAGKSSSSSSFNQQAVGPPADLLIPQGTSEIDQSSSSSNISKHSHKLRIKAPAARAGQKKNKKAKKGKKQASKKKVKKLNPSKVGSNKGNNSPHTIKSILKTSGAAKQLEGSQKSSVNFASEDATDRESSTAKLMPPPKPPLKSPGLTPTPKNKKGGACPLSVVRTAACPPEISKNKSYIRDGNILVLKLKNFMAYLDHTWKFGRGVIFINGRNGSGKSAIQLSVKLVVGGKAANTLRTSSMKHFIKNGSTFSDIEVHFTNYNGTLPKSRYGEVIQLRRRIKYTGGSNYTVRCPDGKWRQIKQHELGLISYSLNIDPNNPFQFLQQDRFKDSSKPGSPQQAQKDFIKFKDATQLTTIEEMLKTAQENLKVATTVIKDKEEMRRFFALQEKQLKEQLDQITKMKMSKNRLAELDNEFGWAKVKVREEEQKQIQAQKEKVDQQVTELKEEKKKLEDDISNFCCMEEKNKKLLQEVKRDIKQFESERDTKDKELREWMRTQKRAQGQHATIISKIRDYSEEIEKLEREMNKETISYETENQKHKADIEAYEAKIVEKEDHLNELRIRRDRNFAEVNEYKATLTKEQSKIGQLTNQLKETTRELNKKDNFGKHMKELLERIDRYKGWKKKPVGPLGQHISVPDAKYAPLIEHILYNALFTFVVQNKDDFNKLKDLIKEVYRDNEKHKQKGRVRDPTVTQISEQNQNMNEYMSKLKVVKDKLKGFKTVLSMLTIKDPMVEMGLVERIGCERIILFESNKAAAAVMKNKTFDEINKGYTLQWFQVSPYPRYQFQPLQGMKCKTDILPMAIDDRKKQINKEIASRNEVIQTCRTNLKGENGLEKQLLENDRQIQGVNKEINELRNKIKYAQSCIRVESEQGGNKDVADQIKLVQEMRASREKEIQMPLKELELAKGEIARIKEEIEKIDSQFPELRKKQEELEGDHHGTNRTVAKLAKEIEDYNGRIRRLAKEFQALAEEENKIYFDLDEKVKEARRLGERPTDLSRPPEVVQQELVDLKAFLDKDKNKDLLKCEGRIQSEYNNSKALVIQITNEIDIINKLCVKFEPLIKVNTDYYEQLKKEMSRQLKSIYGTLVEHHGLTGDVIIDWENKTLMYYVCPDRMADLRAKRNYSQKDGEEFISDKQGVFNYVQGLSGGERSKTLIFFIMAMWRITDMPFHMLDEFEACLDDQSRDSVHKTIIKHAECHPEAQFFILTPLDLSGIHKLSNSSKVPVKIVHIKHTR